MTTLSSSKEDQSQLTERQPGTWSAAILAGLPHLLIGLLIGVSELSNLSIQINKNISNTLGISFGILVIVILIYAWQRAWPLWSASWYIYGSWVVMAMIALTLERLDLKEIWRYNNTINAGWILLCVIGYFILVSKSKLHGLLSVAFLFPMLSILTLEQIPRTIEGWLAISAGILAALAAGIIIRLGDLYPALILVLGSNLAIGLNWAYIREYKMFDLSSGIANHVPQFSNFLSSLAIYSIFGLGVVIFPFILRGLWSFGRRKLAS